MVQYLQLTGKHRRRQTRYIIQKIKATESRRYPTQKNVFTSFARISDLRWGICYIPARGYSDIVPSSNFRKMQPKRVRHHLEPIGNERNTGNSSNFLHCCFIDIIKGKPSLLFHHPCYPCGTQREWQQTTHNTTRITIKPYPSSPAALSTNSNFSSTFRCITNELWCSRSLQHCASHLTQHKSLQSPP